MTIKELEYVKKVLEHIKNPDEHISKAMAYIEKDLKVYAARKGQLHDYDYDNKIGIYW